MRCPDAPAQAKALLRWLQRSYPPGALLKAWQVEEYLYPRFAEEKGWTMRPWGGRQGVGKYLRELPGVEKVSPYVKADDGFKDRFRCYRLPLADTATNGIRQSSLRRPA